MLILAVVLALLGAYVNPGFLYGRLHSESAVIFFRGPEDTFTSVSSR
jgi:hypothetical protein